LSDREDGRSPDQGEEKIPLASGPAPLAFYNCPDLRGLRKRDRQ